VEGKFLASVRPGKKQTGIIGKIKSIRVIESVGGGEMYEITYETKYIELDLQHLDDRIAAINEKLAQAAAVKTRLIEEVQAKDNAAGEVLKNIQEQEKKFSVLEAQKNDTELASGKLTGELDVLNAEYAEVTIAVTDLKNQETVLAAS